MNSMTDPQGQNGKSVADHSGTHGKSENPEVSVDTTRRVGRILRSFHNYSRVAVQMLSLGIPPIEILRSQFPLVSPQPSRPIEVGIELTNWCNMQCVYCTSSRDDRETGQMHPDTFSRVTQGIKQLGVHRVRVVGGGEPTLHPKFPRWIRELASVTTHVQVLSNGQWRKPHRIIDAMLGAPVNQISVSVEGTNKARYERSNKRGSFARLLENLLLLKRQRDKAGCRALIALHIMIRPSDRGKENELREFWRPYCDTVMYHRLIRMEGLDDQEDLYTPVQRIHNDYPRCSLPFKALDVNWDGNVPLCCYSVAQYGSSGFILGNVNDTDLPDIWNGDLLRTYRKAHHKRIPELMPICRGCPAI